MKVIRFRLKNERNKVRVGVVSGKKIIEFRGSIFKLKEETGNEFHLNEIEFLPPLKPRKIVCMGFNYKKHMEELSKLSTNKPTITLKSQNTVIGHREKIVLPSISTRVEHEAELGIIIGKPGYKIKQEKANEHIFGYTIVNDVTARDLEYELKQWSPAKSFPTFCPIGPWIDTSLDASNLSIRCWVNSELRQDANTSEMIYKAEKCVSFVSSFMKLEKGDLIATGTPAGVGVLKAGDWVRIEISNLGILENPVTKENENNSGY